MKKIKLGNTDILVSQMSLGGMYFGTKLTKEQSFEIMDAYYHAGGNSIDTSNNYCFWIKPYVGGESETVIGEWMKVRSNREKIILATKCGAKPKNPHDPHTLNTPEGLSREAIQKAIAGSLERLQTTYIDLYYIHVDWRQDPIEETMKTLHELVKSGKVRALGCSNMATWRMVQANEYAKRNGLTPFSAIQNWYSYLKPRDNADLWVQKFVSDELLDYCQSEQDVTIFPYSTTLSGAYSWDTIYDQNHPALEDRFLSEDNERRLQVIKKIANERNVSVYDILFSWMTSQEAHIVPILGVSKVSQLNTNLSGLSLTLSEDEKQRLSNASFNGKKFYLNG